MQALDEELESFAFLDEGSLGALFLGLVADGEGVLFYSCEKVAGMLYILDCRVNGIFREEDEDIRCQFCLFHSDLFVALLQSLNRE